MSEKAYSLSLSVLATTAAAFVCASMAYADPPSAAAPAPAPKNANTAPPATVAPAPPPRFPATGMIPVSTHYQTCGPCGCNTIANNDAYRFDPTGNNPNIPRGLVGSGYYGAYSPDSYRHAACGGAIYGAAYHDDATAYGSPAFIPTSASYLTGQNGPNQTTYYRPNAAPAHAAAQPATPTRRQYGWW